MRFHRKERIRNDFGQSFERQMKLNVKMLFNYFNAMLTWFFRNDGLRWKPFRQILSMKSKDFCVTDWSNRFVTLIFIRMSERQISSRSNSWWKFVSLNDQIRSCSPPSLLRSSSISYTNISDVHSFWKVHVYI